MNQARLIGTVASEFIYSHEVFKERFYYAYIQIKRKSGKPDLIPALFSERMINTKDNYTGQCITIKGQFRSDSQNGKDFLHISVLEYELLKEAEPDYNDVFLEGYICKNPIYNETALGRESADVVLAVDRVNGEKDYIPCVCCGRNAYYVSMMEVGDCVRFAGRVQNNRNQKPNCKLSVILLEKGA